MLDSLQRFAYGAVAVHKRRSDGERPQHSVLTEPPGTSRLAAPNGLPGCAVTTIPLPSPVGKLLLLGWPPNFSFSSFRQI